MKKNIMYDLAQKEADVFKQMIEKPLSIPASRVAYKQLVACHFSRPGTHFLV
jgi:hypothetical protein